MSRDASAAATPGGLHTISTEGLTSRELRACAIRAGCKWTEVLSCTCQIDSSAEWCSTAGRGWNGRLGRLSCSDGCHKHWCSC